VPERSDVALDDFEELLEREKQGHVLLDKLAIGLADAEESGHDEDELVDFLPFFVGHLFLVGADLVGKFFGFEVGTVTENGWVFGGAGFRRVLSVLVLVVNSFLNDLFALEEELDVFDILAKVLKVPKRFKRLNVQLDIFPIEQLVDDLPRGLGRGVDFDEHAGEG
jgi:hypothetical protein